MIRVYIWILLLFIILIIFSFQDIEQSYAPLKYGGVSSLNQLLVHYDEYKANFMLFLKNTYIFNEGDSFSSNNSFYFLCPLFIISDIFGGISFGNLYRAVAIFGLCSVFVLFLFLKRFWGINIAFLSSIFYGFVFNCVLCIALQK